MGLAHQTDRMNPKWAWGLDHFRQNPNELTDNMVLFNGEYTEKATADGMTLLLASSGESAINPHLYNNMSYDPAKDLDDDGLADDGVIDYSRGAPYDLIWSVDLEDGGDRTPRYASVCVANLSQLHTGGATITPDNTGAARPLQVALVSLVDPTGSDAAEVRAYCASVDPTTLSWVGSGSLPAEYYTPGALIWSYPLAAYDASAEVVAVSSPVVYEDYVYVLASEFDDDLDGASHNSAYGRAHSFRLSYRWDLDFGGARWVYPDSNDDPAGDGVDVAAGPGAGINDDKAFPELQGMLPPFHEPHWVAGVAPFNDPAPRPLLPPSPGADPLPHAGRDGVMDYDYDVVLNMATPVRSIFIARLRPTARVRGTIGVEQKRPILTPGVAKVAWSDAIARSQLATS